MTAMQCDLVREAARVALVVKVYTTTRKLEHDCPPTPKPTKEVKIVESFSMRGSKLTSFLGTR